MTGYFRWDKQGVEVLGKVAAGEGMPFGWPVDKRRLKYLKATVSRLIGPVPARLTCPVPHGIRLRNRRARRLDRCGEREW